MKPEFRKGRWYPSKQAAALMTVEQYVAAFIYLNNYKE